MSMRRFFEAVTLGICLYALAGWLYVVLVALIQPNTLSWQLTHLTSWPRTDTFGELCFVVSFVAFVVHRALTQRHPPDR